jgi:hypothetical protein
LIEADRCLTLDAHIDNNAVCTQRGDAAAAHERKRILHCRDDAPDPRRDDSLGTGAGPSGVRARLERAVERCSSCEFAGFCQRVNFRVRLAGAFMRAVADDNPLVGDDAGADDGIWRRTAQPTTRLLECAPHPPHIRLRAFGARARQVRHHFSWNKAST